MPLLIDNKFKQQVIALPVVCFDINSPKFQNGYLQNNNSMLKFILEIKIKGIIMGKERITDIIKMGEHGSKSSSMIEMGVAKLVTALTLMPTMNVGFDVVKGVNGDVRLNLFPTSYRGHDVEKSTIHLDGGIRSTVELFGAINKVYNHLQIEELLNSEDSLTKLDHILWTALDDTARRARYFKSEEQGAIDRASETSLQINTLRKMLSGNRQDVTSEYEIMLATILASIDFYTNSNTPDRPLSRLSVNDRTYFTHLDKVGKINAAIRSNYKDKDLIDYICARDSMADKKSTYLASRYRSKAMRGMEFSSRSIHSKDAAIFDSCNPEM